MFDPSPQVLKPAKIEIRPDDPLVVSLDRLRRTREFLADGTRWTRGSTIKLDRLTFKFQFCALGALAYQSGMALTSMWAPSVLLVAVYDLCPNEIGRLNAAAERLWKRNGTPPCAVWVNDVLDHAAVLQMFDKAIETAEAELSARTRGT